MRSRIEERLTEVDSTAAVLEIGPDLGWRGKISAMETLLDEATRKAERAARAEKRLEELNLL